MPLNWIVPARRAVVCNPPEGEATDAGPDPTAGGSSDTVTYEQALNAWAASLIEHRDTLVGWYLPGRSESAQQEAFRRTHLILTQWIETFLGSDGSELCRVTVPYQGAHAVALRHLQTISSPAPRFPVRLWKGPYRVLNESGPTQRPEDCIEWSVNRTTLLLNRLKEVVNPSANFFPGDVMEFPLFRFWSAAGVASYRAAIFNPEGSFFLGTSVGQVVGAVRQTEESEDEEETAAETGPATEVSDEDYETLDPGIDEESPAEPDSAATRQVEVVCAGLRITSPGQVRLHDNMLAMRFQLLLNAAIGAYYKTSRVFSRSTQGLEHHSKRVCGGDVNGRGLVYGGALGCVNRRNSPNVFVLASNNWGTANLPSGLSRLAGSTRLTWAWSCSPCALALGYYMVNTASRFSQGGGGQIHTEIQHSSTPLAANADFTQFLPVAVNEDDQLREQRDAAVQAMIGQPGCNLAEALPRLTSERVQPRELTVAQMKPFLGDGWMTVSIARHEYSIVRVWRHDKIIRPVAAGSPPIAGWIAAYNPLDGTSYNKDEDEGHLFIFEAGGPLARTQWLAGTYACSVFGINPFRWEKIDRFAIGRKGPIDNTDRNTFYLGEGTRVRGNRYLVGLTRYDNNAVQAIHDELQAYRPISFYTNPPLIEQTLSTYYPERAVPYPTMAEADDHHVVDADDDRVYIYRSIANAGSNRDAMRTRLGNLIHGGNLTAEGVRQVRAALGSSEFDAYVRETQARLDSQVQFLQRRLEGRGGPADIPPEIRAQIRSNQEVMAVVRQHYRQQQRIWFRLHRGHPTEQDRRALDDAVREEGLRPRQRIRRFRETRVVPLETALRTLQSAHRALLRSAGGPQVADRMELEERLRQAERRRDRFRRLPEAQRERSAFSIVVERINSVRELLGTR